MREPAGRLAALQAISHEFAHVWNVERIRPADLEPFDFTRANLSCCLWFAEGFTDYYGSLLLLRAGLSTTMPLGSVVSVINGAGRSVRSAVQMSEHAPFADAAVANDVDDRSRTFLSYYTWGAAIALGLDLSLREKTDGRVSLDDYMRRLWAAYGAVPPPRPGYVARPYALADLRRELAGLVDDREFADAFFDRHVQGREVMDYARLLNLAGFVLRPIAPGRGWIGDVQVQEGGGGLLVGGRRDEASPSLVPFSSPAYDAGIDAGDLIVSIDDRPATRARWEAIADRAPGERVRLIVERRDGARIATTATLVSDPSVQIIAGERLGSITDRQRAFRQAWLASRVR
jgi:predicted metalloprotease with PDZ domain